MRTFKQAAGLAVVTVMISLAGLAPKAFAQDTNVENMNAQTATAGGNNAGAQGVREDRRDVIKDTRDIRSDRRDIVGDTRDVRSDRRDIRKDIRDGDKAGARQGIKDLHQDKRTRRGDTVALSKDKKERRRDYRELKRDKGGRRHICRQRSK